MTDEQLRAIGWIVTEFANLEGMLAIVVGVFAGVSHERPGMILTTQLSFSNLVSVFESLVYDLNPSEEALDIVHDLVTRARNVNDRRNGIIHSTWSEGNTPDKAIRVKMSLKKGLKSAAEEVTVENLEALAQTISALADDIDDFSGSIYLG
jgi:hypothetical protein